MPRTLDPALLADLSVESTELVHFIEVADPYATPISQGTITKVHSGLLETVEFDQLANLDDFETFGEGTWDLGGVGGRLRVQAPAVGTNPSGIAWNNVTNTFGHVVQMVMHRQVGTDLLSGMPDCIAGIPGPPYADGAGYMGGLFWINPTGTTYPGGPFNEDGHMVSGSNMSSAGNSLGVEFSFFVNGDGGPTHCQLWYHGDFGHALHFFPAGLGVGEIWAGTEGTPNTEGRPGMFVYWTNGTNEYKDNVEFKSLSVYETPYVKFINMPIGTHGEVRDVPAWAGVGSNFNTGTVTTDAGTASAWPDGRPFPFGKVRVDDGSSFAELTPPEGVWGGDIYSYAPPEPTPVLNITTASQDIVWDSKTWVAVHGALVFDGIKETGEASQQGVEITLPAVDVGDALDTILDHAAYLRGLMVKIWIVHLDRETGLPIDVPYMVFNGRLQTGIGISHG